MFFGLFYMSDFFNALTASYYNYTIQQVQMPQNCRKMTRMSRNTAVARKKKGRKGFQSLLRGCETFYAALLNIVFCVSVSVVLVLVLC